MELVNEGASEIAVAAKVELAQVHDRLKRSLDKTVEERLMWSPSPSARCPLHLIAHCAFALGFIREMLEGAPYPAASMAIADAEFLAMEAGITTKEAAMALWQDRYDRYVAFLNTVDDAMLSTMVELPFGLGQAPIGALLDIGAVHTREHLAQLDYIQTIYGDRSW